MAVISPSKYGSGIGMRRLARPIARLSAHLRNEWRQRWTERMLEALPAEIRKDIGWPARDTIALKPSASDRRPLRRQPARTNPAGLMLDREED